MQTKIWFFLGLHNVLYHFILNFSFVAAPLNQEFCKEKLPRVKILSVNGKSAVETLTLLLANLSVLDLLRADVYLTIDTDACDPQLGCALIEEQRDRTIRPNGY